MTLPVLISTVRTVLLLLTGDPSTAPSSWSMDPSDEAKSCKAVAPTVSVSLRSSPSATTAL
eukprot:6349844-Amphidinium_carterae.1